MPKDDAVMAVSSPRGAAWYVIQCRANQNFRAQENLENQGFTCFQPRLCVEKLRAGRRRRCHEPLIPGYLFIQLHEQGQSWHAIRSTRGVQKLVGPASAAPSPRRWAVSSTVSALAACATRRKSRVTGAPTLAPCPASSPRHSRKPAPPTR
ncbi:hypothetical protein CEK60_21765 [Halomonas sp. N3-2A]|nr:hypothetical protein CEK60_21765 [Halomonas sp. N3-2A]